MQMKSKGVNFQFLTSQIRQQEAWHFPRGVSAKPNCLTICTLIE